MNMFKLCGLGGGLGGSFLPDPTDYHARIEKAFSKGLISYAQAEAYMASYEAACKKEKIHNSDKYTIDGECSVIDVKRLEGKS